MFKIEDRIARDHPLRRIRAMVELAMKGLRSYGRISTPCIRDYGRPLIPPGRLAMLERWGVVPSRP